MRQKTIRVFEVEDFEKLKKVVESKYELIKRYYFLLKEENREIQEYLKEKKLSFFVLNSSSSNIEPQIKVVEVEKIVEKIIKDNNTQIFDRIIRSGEELILEGNIIFSKRINPGAKIEIKGNLILLGENNGLIRVEGDFALIKKNRGIIFFNQEEINEIKKTTFFYKDKRIEL